MCYDICIFPGNGKYQANTSAKRFTRVMNNLKLNGSKPDFSDGSFDSDKSVLILMGRISRQIFEMASNMLGYEDLQTSEKRILNSLNEDDGVNQLELVKKTKLKAPTVSVALSKLESKGFVRREMDENDHRSVLVYLNDEGRKYSGDIRETIASLEHDFLVGLTDSEKENLVNCLTQIQKRVNNRKYRKG